MWFFKKDKKEPSVQRSFVAIRMEAIGGQGANSAGKIFAEAAVLGMGYTGNHFSSFGSEKRGSPVRSFVRLSTEKKPVRSASFIRNPDILVVFHESLLKSHQEVLEGVSEMTELIVNSVEKPHNVALPPGIKLKRITTIDATTLARKAHCGLNAVMLGALSEACPEVSQLCITNALQSYFSKLPPDVVKNNLIGFESAFKSLRSDRFRQAEGLQTQSPSPLPKLGWENAPIGGVITNPGNSVLKDHSASRKGLAPLFTKEICFNCGYCDMVCPDFCFVWTIDPTGQSTPQLQGIDYQYCKACQKCVSVCPVQALTLANESEIPSENKAKSVFPHIHTEQLAKNREVK